MNFTTTLPYREPDGTYYANLKHITILDHQPGEDLAGETVDESFAALREALGEETFDNFYGPRLRLAAAWILGHDFIARFPGTHVPDLGNDGRVYSVGSLALDRFVRAARWQGGVMDEGDKPVFSLESTPRVAHWPWAFPEPEITTIVPAPVRPVASEEVLRAFSEQLLSSGDPLRMIESAWSPRTRPGHDDQSRLLASVCLQGGVPGLPLLFELEDVIAHARWMRRQVCVGRGVYRGCYLEVYMQALQAIRNTELAQTLRVLQELRSLIERGFAPIVVNEYGANVDGTHRQTASWLWNLLHRLSVQDLNLSADRLHTHVAAFLAQYADLMGPVTVREVLRILAELIRDPASRQVLAHEILPATFHHPQVWKLPVLFLREASWPTVRYREYLDGERAVRVDPLVYEAMRDDPSLVLPAHGQGPYHLTDRELVPWFNILAINS